MTLAPDVVTPRALSAHSPAMPAAASASDISDRCSFIGTLAFSEPAQAAQLRLGVLTGSVLAATLGYLLLRLSAPAPRESRG